ncbi:MAG TPA: squalene synthase HpnC [Caulobacteraceae bacterium]|nr:squalene synthase HpnC [Caulobacteraceae bacterium]
MTAATAAPAAGSGKGHTDENFPVGSVLIARRNRPVVLAFYRVARMADDVADHPDLSSQEKLDQLELIEASLTGSGQDVAAAVVLRKQLAQRQITERHVLDLLEAFRRDAVKSRYASWTDLMDYCRYSAAPVGRFMLDVHGESRALWPESDALCAALQIINHLQDCAKDYRDIDRVYVPADALAAEGLSVEALAAPEASAALRRVIASLADRTEGLLASSRGFGALARDVRIGLEIGVIEAIAQRLVRRLQTSDPLSERVHLTSLEAIVCAAGGAGRTLAGRLFSRQARAAAA